MNILILIYWCWAIYVVFWVVAAFSTKPAAERSNPWRGLLYRLLLMVASVMLFAGQLLPKFRSINPGFVISIAQPVYQASSAVMVLGLIVTFLGLLLALWARVTLGRNWSSSVMFKQEHQLIQWGPYALVRHPIYTALLLMYIGTFIAQSNLGGILGFPFASISFWLKLKQEEALMLAHFPADYPAYQGRVKRLIPFVF